MGSECLGVTVHYNPRLKHHFGWTTALVEGIGKFGHTVIPTTDPSPNPGTINVVIGPHYCLKNHLNVPNTLFLDRCFFSDPTIHASIGWLRPDGSRNFKNEKSPPNRWDKSGMHLKLWKDGTAAVVFGDYTTDPERYRQTILEVMQNYDQVFYRPHPQQPGWSPPCPVIDGPLPDVFKVARVAIGWRSSVLVDAVINGIPVVCLDSRNVVAPVASEHINEIVFAARQNWAYNLAHSQWHVSEIANGDAWGHLWD